MNRTINIGCVVFCTVLVYALPGFAFAQAADLHIIPENVRVVVGKPFTVQVVANTDNQASFAAEAELSFDPKSVSVQSISKEGSVLSSWVTEPAFSNKDGIVRFSGTAKEKFNGNDQVLVSITLLPLSAGTGALRLLSGALLASDGRGSNIIATLSPSSYDSSPSVVEPTMAITISATTTEDDAVSTALSPQVLGASTVISASIWDYPVAPKVGERLIVKGTAMPNAQVFIVTTQDGSNEVVGEILSSSDGSFTYASDERLSSGAYRLWAQAEAADGSRGERSKEVTFVVLSDQFALSALASGTKNAIPWVVSVLFVVLAILSIIYLQKRSAKTKN